MNLSIDPRNFVRIAGRQPEFVQLGKFSLSEYIDGVEIAVHCERCGLGLCAVSRVEHTPTMTRKKLHVSPCPRCVGKSR